MIGAQLTARAPGHRHLGDLALLAIPLVSVLVSFASVQAGSHSTALGHAAKVTDGAELADSERSELGMLDVHDLSRCRVQRNFEASS